MMELFTININTIQSRFHNKMCEWSHASVMLGSGLVLLFSTTFTLPPFEVVRLIAEQRTWAVVMTTIGICRIMLLLANGEIRRGSPHLRSGLALCSAVLWAFLLAGLFAYQTPLLLGPFLLSAIVFEAANSYRAAQEARHEDDAVGGENGNTSG